MNYSIPSIFTGLNNNQKNEYSYRDRWEKWREHLKKHPESQELSIIENEPALAPKTPQPSQKPTCSARFTPIDDDQAATLFCTSLLTRG